MEPALARRMLRTLEPYHALVYLAPEAEPAYVEAGLEPGRMGYFASRSAPMGAVPAEITIATFYVFQPDLVRSVIPRAWTLASPGAVLEARQGVVDAVLRRLLGDDVVGGAEVREAAALAEEAAEACSANGRSLYGGHASLPWPDQPHLRLWHALTLLREFRGDGHVASLVAADHSGCDAMVMHAATGEINQAFAASRAWSPEQWAASQDNLRRRGYLDAGGGLTEAGRGSRQWVEDRTDEIAMPPWRRLGEERCDRLRELVRPWSRTISDSLFAVFRSAGAVD
jgi:hypothetical protein